MQSKCCPPQSTPKTFAGDSSPPRDQFFPWIEVDATGRIHLTFYDTRRATNPDQHDRDIPGRYDNYYAYSDTEGQTWTVTPLTPTLWTIPPRIAQNSIQFADYIGMGVTTSFAFPCFTEVLPDGQDPTTGQGDIFMIRVPH